MVAAMAQICDQCGFGSKKDNCVKCGKRISSRGAMAQLCNQCGFGSKKDDYIKCGKRA